jgi:hypothetical protein
MEVKTQITISGVAVLSCSSLKANQIGNIHAGDTSEECRTNDRNDTMWMAQMSIRPFILRFDGSRDHSITFQDPLTFQGLLATPRSGRLCHALSFLGFILVAFVSGGRAATPSNLHQSYPATRIKCLYLSILCVVR